MSTLTSLGGVSEVTGSCHLLESPIFGRVLLDCGMHQGGDDVDRYKKEKFAFKAKSIDAVVLSHGHLDHSGLLPKLVHEGFEGPIFCTRATRDLLGVLLRDSFGLYSADLERENRRRERAGRKLLAPAYTADDVRHALDQCIGYDYHEEFSVGNGLSVNFLDAGHILGSAIVQLNMTEPGGNYTLVYSGDIGGTGAVLMNDPEIPAKADLVMMESTYGNRDHRDMQSTIEQLETILHETWDSGGNVLIPAFAVGRTQEIIFHLGLLAHEGRLDNWQIFLDSPMAIAVTEIYDQWIDLLNQSDAEMLKDHGRESLKEFLPRLRLCESVDQSMAINKIKSGAIIIAGSGMCTGGRIRHHIKHRIWHENTTMIFIGFQASGTLGRILVDGVDRIRLYHESFVVKARIETLGGFSAHAGQSDLIGWLTAIGGSPEVVLVHGEPSVLQALATELHGRHKIHAAIPHMGDTRELTARQLK